MRALLGAVLLGVPSRAVIGTGRVPDPGERAAPLHISARVRARDLFPHPAQVLEWRFSAACRSGHAELGAHAQGWLPVTTSARLQHGKEGRATAGRAALGAGK